MERILEGVSVMLLDNEALLLQDCDRSVVVRAEIVHVPSGSVVKTMIFSGYRKPALKPIHWLKDHVGACQVGEHAVMLFDTGRREIQFDLLGSQIGIF